MKVAALLLLTVLTPATATVTVAIKPSVCLEPCKIDVKLSVTEAAADRQQICLALADAGGLYTRSCWPRNDRYSWAPTVSGIPAGDYAVRGAACNTELNACFMSAEAPLQVK